MKQVGPGWNGCSRRRRLIKNDKTTISFLTVCVEVVQEGMSSEGFPRIWEKARNSALDLMRDNRKVGIPQWTASGTFAGGNPLFENRLL